VNYGTYQLSSSAESGLFFCDANIYLNALNTALKEQLNEEECPR
jgi:hypothetical protein